MSLFPAQSPVCKDPDDLAELRQAAAEFYRQNRVPEQLERVLNELFTRDRATSAATCSSPPPRSPLTSGLRDSDSDSDLREQVSNALQWIQEVNQQLQELKPDEQSRVTGSSEVLHTLTHSYCCSAPWEQERYCTHSHTPTAAAPPGNKKGKKGSALKLVPPPEAPEVFLSGGLAVGVVSLSVARAGARSRGVALYEHVAQLKRHSSPPQMSLPSVLVSLLSCGKSSPGKLHLFEEILLILKPGQRVKQVLSVAQELQKEIQRILSSRTKATSLSALLSDCGAPCLFAEKPEQPLELVSEACSNLELGLGSEVFLGLSCAAPGLFDCSKGKYEVCSGLLKSPDEMVDLLVTLVTKNPGVVVLIDPLRREDREQWERLSSSLSDSCSLLSDLTYRAQAPPPPGVRGHVLKHAHHVTVSDLVRASVEQPGCVLLGPAHSEPASDSALPDLVSDSAVKKHLNKRV
ncbi:hypothetical protein WMY93_018428 [Mugilogobius chulae]|uniref:phosphopyruvate hydratase n=1 Tax=Mugilogobius chulae TaxID=88201 RepID=A0AAW0NW38_9GOBI